jgi:hypothetical protein
MEFERLELKSNRSDNTADAIFTFKTGNITHILVQTLFLGRIEQLHSEAESFLRLKGRL